MTELPNNEQWLIIQSINNTKEILDSVITNCKNILNAAENLRNKIQFTYDKYITQKKYYMLDYAQWQKDLSTFFNGLLVRMSSIYLKIQTQRKDPFVAKLAKEKSFDYAFDILIDLLIIDEMLIVKTPPLLNKYKTYRSSGKSKYIQDYLPFFAYEVSKKMSDYSNKIPQYASKNITVFSVYPTGFGELPDAENLDSKRIIDAITEHFPATDNGKFCSIYQLCISSDKIQQGAYFIVTKGFAKPPNFDDILTVLKTNFGAVPPNDLQQL